MANSSLVLSSLDFDTLKENFKEYLSTQSIFKDYNFDGSNINVLLDVMAYNSHLNAFYLNMVASEMFLDSAQKLDSVVSHAKELNYLPRSRRSAKAIVSFTIDTVGIENPLIIEKGTQFSGSNANGSFSFVTKSERSFLSANSRYTVESLEIYEGRYTNDIFVVNYEDETQRFILTDPTVDTDSIEVTVSQNGTNTSYLYAETLYNLNSNSAVFFLQPAASSRYEVVFGDNIFGKRPVNGALVYINYRVTSGSEGNGISSFALDDDIGRNNNGSATVDDVNIISPSISGANAESISSIKFNAPRHFQKQGRCIVSSDYEISILQNFPEVQYVSVYSGGITNTAVEYGTVYISPSTYSGTILPETRKQDIKSYVESLAPIGITTRIIDPDYLKIALESVIHVNFNKTVSSPANIIAKASVSISNFNTDNLRKFNTALRLSKLEQYINESDVGVLSNETNIRLFKTFSPSPILSIAVFCDYKNPIQKGTVTSSSFNIDSKTFILTDSVSDTAPDGTLYLYELNLQNSTQNYVPVGQVDYTLGTVSVNAINYFDVGGGLKIYAKPLNKDIYCKDNTIIEIDTISGLSLSTTDQ